MIFHLMRYFKQHWDDSLIDQDWGGVTYYGEYGDDGYATRQIEVFDKGIVLKYDEQHFQDNYGMLDDGAFQEDNIKITDDPAVLEISQAEFERAWQSLKAFNR